MGHVPNDVFQFLGPVSALNQCGELGTDFVLTSASHFVVEHFNGDAHFFQDQGHLGTHVLHAVDRRHWEVAALDGRTMAFVAAFHHFVRIPRGFVFVDLEESARHVVGPTHVVEDEEFGLWSKVSGIAKTRGLQVSLSALGDRTWVTVIRLAVTWLEHVAAQNQSRFLKEGVDEGRHCVGHQQHVRGFDTFPSSDG